MVWSVRAFEDANFQSRKRKKTTSCVVSLSKYYSKLNMFLRVESAKTSFCKGSMFSRSGHGQN
jgi:hypothetical protein